MRTIFGSAAALAITVACASCAGPQISSTAAPLPQATDAAASPKYTYVLVHGAGAGGFEWKNVGDRLLKDGHYVERPTMTGMGAAAHPRQSRYRSELSHITDIVNVILFDNLHDVVLMGHSYGGMVITGVADRVPDRIKCVIYVDAFLPEDGERPERNRPAGRPEPRGVRAGVHRGCTAGGRAAALQRAPAGQDAEPAGVAEEPGGGGEDSDGIHSDGGQGGEAGEDDRFYQSCMCAPGRNAAGSPRPLRPGTSCRQRNRRNW